MDDEGATGAAQAAGEDGKKAGKKGKKKKDKEPKKTNLEVYDEVKTRFELQTARERANHYEGSYKELRQKNEILKSQYYSQRDTQADILKTLRAQLEEQFEKVEKYEQIIDGLHRTIDETEIEHKHSLEEKDEKWVLKMKEAQDKIEDLQTALDHVKSYIKKRNELQDKLTSLEKQLSDANEQHANEISLLDRKKAVEIDQLKKDMLAKIRETRDSLRLKTKDQLDVITKRTIMENEQMCTELQFQSRETEKLIEKNKRLYDENLTLRRNVQLHKELEEELAKRTHIYQKLIKRLNNKLEVSEKRLQEVSAVAGNSNKTNKPSQSSVNATVKVSNAKVMGDHDHNTSKMMGSTQRSSESSAAHHTAGAGSGGGAGAGETGGPGHPAFSVTTATGSTFSGTRGQYDPASASFIVDGGGTTSVSGADGAGNINLDHYATQSSSGFAMQQENEALKRTLEQSRTDFSRFKRDHMALMHLQDQTTRLIVLELYRLKQEMERSFRESGTLESYFERLEHEQDAPAPPGQQKHVFQRMTQRQRQLFFKVLLDKLAVLHSANFKLPPVTNNSSSTTAAPTDPTGHTNMNSAGSLQSPKAAETRTVQILSKILTQVNVETKGVQTLPISEPIAPDGQGVAPEWYGHAAQFRKEQRAEQRQLPGKNFRANVIRGEVRGWGQTAQTMPLKRAYMGKK